MRTGLEPKPPPDLGPPLVVAPPPHALQRDINDAALLLLAIDSMACPYPELAPIGRAVQQCRALLTARGAQFPSSVAFQIGISSIGGGAL